MDTLFDVFSFHLHRFSAVSNKFFFLVGIAMHLIVSDIMTGHLTGGRGKFGQAMDEQDVIVS